MKKYILMIGCVLAAYITQAQTIYSISYDTSLGLGDTGDFAGNFNGRGVTMLDIRAYVTDNLTVGGSFGWHVLYEEETGTFEQDNLTVSGTQKRYLNSFPIMANVHYNFGEDGEITPYAGLGIGTYSIERRVDMGLFSDTINQWHFGLAPEVGVIFPVAYNSALILKAKYNHAFEAGGVPQRQYMVFGIGYAWY